MKKFLCILLCLMMGCASAEYQTRYTDTTNCPVITDEPIETPAPAEERMDILLMGEDTRDTDGYSRSDSMILLSVYPESGRVKLTSFMRDTWVEIPGRSSKNKLNAACRFGGPTLTLETINNAYGTNIENYVLINLTCMAEVIDLVGGLTLDVTKEERDALNKGLFNLSEASGMTKLEDYGEGVLLNGNQAVAYSRIRHIDSEYARTQRQRTVLVTLAKRLQQENPLKLASLVTTLLGYVETNLSASQLLSLAKIGMTLDMDAVEQYRVPAEGTYKDGTFNGVWCIKPDFEENAELLAEFLEN